MLTVNTDWIKVVPLVNITGSVTVILTSVNINEYILGNITVS